MKKILTRIFSLVLAVALTAPTAFADIQKARKANGTAMAELKHSAMHKAMPKGLLEAKGVTPLPRKTSKAAAENIVPAVNKHLTVKQANPAAKSPVKIQKAEGQLPTIIGSMIYSDEDEYWGEDGGFITGLYNIPTAEGQTFGLIKSGIDASYGGVLIDDVYYATVYEEFWGIILISVKGVDINTGEIVYNAAPQNFDAVLKSASVDPTTDLTYCVGFNEDGHGLQLATIEYSESGITTQKIADFNYNTSFIAFDSTGQLWGVCYAVQNGTNTVIASYLVKIDKTNGAIEIIGEGTGQIPQYISGGAFDLKTDRLFWTVCNADDEGYLTEIDLTTGVATPLYMFPGNEEIVGVQIPYIPEANAPAAVTDLAVNFPEGSLTGTVSFTAPTTYYDGSAASGELSYTILVDGQTIEGTTSFGQEVSEEVLISGAGAYKFTVFTSNAAGESPKTKLTEFIGNGVPVAPQPVLTYADGTLTLTWEPVTESVDGGYIDASAVTYVIKDAETEEIVADGITATSWSKEQPEPAKVTVFAYTVTAVCNEISSAAGQSNSIVLGSVVPPYTNTFDTEEDCADFISVDANDDGKTWSFYGGAMRVMYNGKVDMDDWLISVPFKLEAGKSYNVSMDLRGASATYTEKVEAFWGTAPEIEAMTNVLFETVSLKSNEYSPYGGTITPETDGIYYIGIHGCSEMDMYYILLDNFTVGAGLSPNAPAAVSDIVATPAAYGALYASISFTAPDKTLGGAPLESIEKIEVSRGGEVIAVKTGVTPGATVKVADQVETFGTYTYTITAYNADGAGLSESTSCYIGLAAPNDVSDVKVTGSGNRLHVEWTAPATDVMGNAIAPGQLTYNIMFEDNSGRNVVAENVEGNTFDYTFETEVQQFVQFYVLAFNEVGSSDYYIGSNPYAAGPAYPGFDFSLPDAQFGDYIFYSESDGGAWIRCSDDGINNSTYFNDVKSYDGDNGFIMMKGSAIDDSAALITGSISLAGIENPGVSFVTYVLAEDDINELSIAVSPTNANDWKVLKEGAVNTFGTDGWVKVIVPLNEYAGKDIQLRIGAVCKKYAYTLFDAIKVGSLLSYDLKAKAIAAPAKVAAGDDYTVTVTVANEGTKESAAATVELYALTATGYKVVATEACEALQPEESTTVEFVRNMSPLATADDAAVYYATVVYGADEDATNNTTESVTVTPVVSNLPVVTDLKGEAAEAGNILTWNEPDLTAGVPDPTTESFEDAETFTEEYKDWIFVDVDEAPIYSIDGADMPGITPGQPHSWFVFDASGEQFNESYAAATGTKYLASMATTNAKATDDWAITPALNGCAQTITFKAKSYTLQYGPEKFRVYYSEGSTDVNDFIALGDEVTVNTDAWTEYSFEVPEGAKRFAIRSRSADVFLLLIDDVTFIPGDAVADLTLVGYDIYRDGEKLNAEVVGETTYTDTNVEAGKQYTYNVVAIYTTGASAPSDPCTVTTATSALTDIFAGINISAAKGEIVITGAEGLAVQVVAVDGKVLFSGLGETKTSVAVIPGVYVVKAADKVSKLIVR